MKGNPRFNTDTMSADTFLDGRLPADGIVLASFDGAAADPVPVEFTVPPGARMVTVILTITALTGGGNLTLNLQAYDPAEAVSAGNVDPFVTLVTSVALTGTGTTRYQAGDTALTTANVSQNTALPRVLRVKPVKGGTTTTLVYSIGAWFS